MNERVILSVGFVVIDLRYVLMRKITVLETGTDKFLMVSTHGYFPLMRRKDNLHTHKLNATHLLRLIANRDKGS